jgi:hypothetical protein
MFTVLLPAAVNPIPVKYAYLKRREIKNAVNELRIEYWGI